MTRIFYEDWQLQCCGEPFVVGAEVKWTVRRPQDNPPWLPEVEPIDWYGEHHGNETHALTGSVERIEATWRNYRPQEPGSRMLVPIAGTFRAQDVQSADGWEELNRSSEKFEGYLVTLVLTAQPTEVPGES